MEMINEGWAGGLNTGARGGGGGAYSQIFQNFRRGGGGVERGGGVALEVLGFRV